MNEHNESVQATTARQSGESNDERRNDHVGLLPRELRFFARPRIMKYWMNGVVHTKTISPAVHHNRLTINERFMTFGNCDISRKPKTTGNDAKTERVTPIESGIHDRNALNASAIKTTNA